jgi:hypothetical protein
MLMPISKKVLYKDKFLAIQILSASMARQVTQDEPYFVISIVSKGFDNAILAKSPSELPHARGVGLPSSFT